MHPIKIKGAPHVVKSRFPEIRAILTLVNTTDEVKGFKLSSSNKSVRFKPSSGVIDEKGCTLVTIVIKQGSGSTNSETDDNKTRDIESFMVLLEASGVSSSMGYEALHEGKKKLVSMSGDDCATKINALSQSLKETYSKPKIVATTATQTVRSAKECSCTCCCIRQLSHINPTDCVDSHLSKKNLSEQRQDIKKDEIIEPQTTLFRSSVNSNGGDKATLTLESKDIFEEEKLLPDEITHLKSIFIPSNSSPRPTHTSVARSLLVLTYIMTGVIIGISFCNL